MSLLLFTRNPPAVYKPDYQQMAQNVHPGNPGGGGGGGTSKKVVEPPPTSQSGAFALSAAEWHLLAAFANTAMQMRGAVGEAVARQHALGQLAGAWGSFAPHVDRWEQARSALIALGKDIVAYAQDVVPPLYKRIGDILLKLSDKPDAAAANQLRALLADATSQADSRAQRAAQLSGTIGPFADAARSFIAALYGTVRNPPIRVELDEIPNLCLSVGGDGLAIAGDEHSGTDRLQLWVIEQVSPDGPYALRTADRHRELTIDTVRFPSGPIIGNMTFPSRPHLAPTSGGSEALFWFTSDRYIQPARWQNCTLDCSGNDGWQQGTPILTYGKNGGRNQRWRVHPRSFWDLHFYDVCATIGRQAAGIPPFQRLEGDWRAVAKDLNDGIAGVLHNIDTGDPFTASLDVDATVQAWTDTAKEALAAVSGL